MLSQASFKIFLCDLESDPSPKSLSSTFLPDLQTTILSRFWTYIAHDLYHLRMYIAGRRRSRLERVVALGRHVSPDRSCAQSWLAPTRMIRAISALQRRPNTSGQYVQAEANDGAHRRLYRAETPHHSLQDPTIYALSTAPGRAAIAIVRISGPACMKVLFSLS